MSRQQRRQESRKGKPPFPWEKLIISVILIFFLGTAAFTYFFPAINARTYANGSARVQKIIISRGVSDLQEHKSSEFLFATNQYLNAEEELSWKEFKVEETSDGLVFTDGDEVAEYPLQSPPEYYSTVENTVADVEAALKDRSYKVRHPQPEDKESQILILEKQNDDVHMGYVLYFTEDHQIDSVHVFELLDDNTSKEHVYSGLITGIPEGYGEEEEPNTGGTDD